MAKLLGIFVGMAGLTASLFYAANLGGSQTSAQGVLSRDAMTEIALAEEKKTDSTGLPDAPSIRDANATAAGAVELIGVAPPDADVTLLVNEKPSGVQKAGADGKWTFSLELPDKTAEQTLSVQVKDAKGMAFAVAERVKVVPGEGGNPPKLTLLMQDGSERVLQSGVAQETGLIVERAETAPGGKVLLAGRGDADMIVKAL
ncbi:MAG TPA: hypothetical protein DCL48_02840, partial [Alphaproteobacteria bacterium]|nr:hypothetical protein [Alphaproteobacteria bacterium]